MRFRTRRELTNNLKVQHNLSIMKEWDPLAETPGADEIINAAKKREIKNIIKSYTGWYDSFSELIQNALDAIDERIGYKEEGYVPRLQIDINLAENTFRVIDNGIGFGEEQLKLFLTPNISFKTSGKTRGSKGVGAKFLAYGFNHLEIGTKSPTTTFYGMIKNARDWVDDKSGTVPRPLVKEIQPIPNELDSIDRGSLFCLKYTGKNIRPGDLNSYFDGANNAEKWEAVLRIKTPLGGIYLNDTKPVTKCLLKVVDTNGVETQKEIANCEYVYPHEIVSSVAKLKDILDTQKSLVDKGKSPEKDLPAKFKKLNGIYEIWNHDDILNRTTSFSPQLSEDDKTLVAEVKPVVYGFFTYSVDIWDMIDQKIGLEHGARLLRGGLNLATLNMIQGNPLVIPLTANIGYQKTSHVIVHFENIDVDLGRKGFQPEMVRLAESLSVSVVNYLKKWKDLLKIDTGEVPDISESSALHDWIREQEEHEKNYPLIINNKNFFLPVTEVPTLSEPVKEQDVIVLFNQLVAGGVIRGVRILSTSQTMRYDSLCRVILNKPLENHAYHPEKNPLGLHKENMNKEFKSEPWVMEYKCNLDALIEDFEKGSKEERDVKLVVCWEAGEKWKQRYTIVPLMLEENLNHRPFHGATHEVKSENTGQHAFYMVVMSELIDFLNNPGAEETNQKTKYSSE